MANLARIVRQLKKEHDRAVNEVRRIAAALAAFGAAYGKPTGTRKLSAAARSRIAAAQRARWAKVRKDGGEEGVTSTPKKRTMSASARKKIAAAQKLRWAKVKAQKK